MKPQPRSRARGGRELAIREGVKIARYVFAKRGNHTEAHISEAELAALLAVAFERGAESSNEGRPR